MITLFHHAKVKKINQISKSNQSKNVEILFFIIFFFYFCIKYQKGMRRERNFEVLRTMAMFFIVVYHCLTHGIGDGYAFPTSMSIPLSNVLFSDFMLVFSSISVNLYVLISGYFLVDLNFKLSRIVRTWANACFYSCVITSLFMLFQISELNILNLGKSFFPLSTDAYWFVTQYIGLLILSPFLSLMVRNLSYRQYLILLICGSFLCLSIVQDFPLGKRFHVAHGNSVWSFAYLYLVAGFVKHHLKTISRNRLILTIVLVTLLTFAFEIFGGYNKDAIYLYWLNYNGLPFVLSVAVFIMVRQIQVPQNVFWNLCVKIAPYTFGVYLIHDHLLVRKWLWTTMTMSSYCEKLIFPLIVIGICSIIFIVGTIIDVVRKKLFALLGIDNLIVRVDRWSFYS